MKNAQIRGAVLVKRATCFPRALFVQRGQLPPLPPWLRRPCVQYFTSQRRFSIRGISRVTRGYFLTLFAFYSLVSSVTYLQILTTNLFCCKFYKFQFFKKSLVWKFCNKIFAFKLSPQLQSIIPY